MIAVFFTNEMSSYTEAMKLSLSQGVGITTGALILSFEGSHFKHWKWQLAGAATVMTIFGGLLALGNPNRKALCIAFTYLSSVRYGYAQYLSIAYIQFGADQVELGIAGGLA